MIEQTKWIDRKFNFDFPSGVFPCLLERLKGTPTRAEKLVEGVDERILEQQADGKWSAKEYIGHIIDVELLWEARLEQFLAGVETLRAADMSNKRTHNANHNDRTISDLLIDLYETRNAFVAKLEKLSDEEISRSALHPRLNKPMRLVDMIYFIAEHDDNELALMRKRIKSLS